MVMIVLKWLLAMLLTSVPFVFHYCIKPKAASSDKWRNFYSFLLRFSAYTLVQLPQI